MMMKCKLFKEPARARVFLRAGSFAKRKAMHRILNKQQEGRQNENNFF